MAWVSYQRITDGVSVTGKYGESMVVTEKWQIRVDTPNTSKYDIIAGMTGQAGITWGTPHFEFSSLKAMEFECAPATRDGMLWYLTVKYYEPPPQEVPQTSGIPKDVWERAGGTTSVPAFRDKDGNMIVNAAGDPLEGLEKERDESSWTFTKRYTTDAALQADIANYGGHVNSGAWAGGSAKTWKCYFVRARLVSATKVDNSSNGETLNYIEAQWEFRYDAGTWKLMPWDVGFMEKKSGKKQAIMTDDSPPKVVKQPVALNTDGSARAAGNPPLVANNGNGFDIYPTADFAGGFGTPHLMPT